jgi:hypothetical protein
VGTGELLRRIMPDWAEAEPSSRTAAKSAPQKITQHLSVVSRATKHLVFMSGVFMVESRVVAVVNGVWKKILRASPGSPRQDAVRG